MRLWVISIMLFIAPAICKSQYKNDNILFKTVYLQNLCDSLNQYPDRLIIDVRSPAEFNEEQMKGMSGHSLGHFKSAINIDVQQLGNRLDEINSYKDRPVFIICSHSQRSRRASLFLSKNGFTNVLNINGGMTSIHQLPVVGNECIYKEISTNLKYKLLSPFEVCKDINDGNVFILDVRPESNLGGISVKDINRFIGRFKNSFNIPINNLLDRVDEIPRNRKVIITDVGGDDLDEAAGILISKGYTDVNILNGGIEQLMTTDSRFTKCRKEVNVLDNSVHIIGSADLLSIFQNPVKTMFLDVRPAKEYLNKSNDAYKNIGHIKGAINVTVGDLPFKINELFPNKNVPVVIYSFSSDNDNYIAAKILSENGFKNIYILSRGIFNVRWTANNFKEYRELSALIADVPEENL